MPFQSRRHWGLGVGGGGVDASPQIFSETKFLFLRKTGK